VCTQDEPGYVQTFHRAATRVALELGRARASGEPASYRTVYVTSIKGAPVGFERSVYRKAKDGSRTGFTFTAMVVPRTPSELMLQDSQASSHIGKDGYIDEKKSRVVANGEVQLDLTLKRDKGNGYSYSGRMSDKDLSGSFKTKDKHGIASDVAVVRAVKAELMTGRKPQVQFEQYMPDADPTAPMVVTMRRDGAGPNAVTVETAKLKMTGVVDASGDLTSLDMPMGPINLAQERKFVEGSIE